MRKEPNLNPSGVCMYDCEHIREIKKTTPHSPRKEISLSLCLSVFHFCWSRCISNSILSLNFGKFSLTLHIDFFHFLILESSSPLKLDFTVVDFGFVCFFPKKTKKKTKQKKQQVQVDSSKNSSMNIPLFGRRDHTSEIYLATF